jgi:phosphoribosyl-AMP cyclohydrolase
MKKFFQLFDKRYSFKPITGRNFLNVLSFITFCFSFIYLNISSFVLSGSKTYVIFTKELYPVVTQDPEGIILMQAYLNKESLNLSFNIGYAHYFSRSRNRLWKKGEESGHLQKVISIFYNNDFKFYVYNVEQISNACHTGSYSCFFRKVLDGKIYTL